MHARDQFMLATTVLSFVFESENIISFLVVAIQDLVI